MCCVVGAEDYKPMARSIVVILCTLAMIVTLAVTPMTQAQSETGLQLITEESVPGSRDVKFPHVGAGNGTAIVTGVADRNSPYAWAKADSAGEFPARFDLGESGGGDPDYLNTAITFTPDGSAYAVWTTLEQGRIYLRRRDTAGNWGPTRTVANSNFPIFVEIAVSTKGEIFVLWSEPGKTPLYRVSTNQGVNWSSTRNVGNVVAFSSQMDLTAGPNGSMAAAYTGASGGVLQVFLGLWNGSGFEIRRMSTLDIESADATVTFGPDGRIYYAWRGIEGGVYFTEQQADGSFPRSRLAGSRAYGLVNLNTDEGGNIHFNWIAEPGGNKQIFYAFKEPNSAPRGPIASSNGGSIFNSHAAASASDAIYAHTVLEEFTGGGLRTRYSLWRAEGSIFGATPVLANGAAITGGKATVTLNFTNLRGGTPTEIRWRWGAAPTDSATDSGGFKAFANPLEIPIPAAILNNTTCQPTTLYTQVRDTTTGTLEKEAKSDSIIIDGVVEASAIFANPYLYVDTAPENAGLDKVAGALNGARNYTRIPLMYVDITSFDDCTDLKSVGIGRSANAIETVIAVTDEGYRGFVPLPGLADLQEGEVPIVLQVTDGAGNVRNFSGTIIFDETPPVLDPNASGPLQATANPNADLLQNLTFSNVSVSDTGVGDRDFWGVWLAVSRTPVANPTASDDLVWIPVSISENATSFTVRNFSLASGLPDADVTPGTYYVYARFLDAAGNASTAFLDAVIESNAERPKTNLPLIVR